MTPFQLRCVAYTFGESPDVARSGFLLLEIAEPPAQGVGFETMVGKLSVAALENDALEALAGFSGCLNLYAMSVEQGATAAEALRTFARWTAPAVTILEPTVDGISHHFPIELALDLATGRSLYAQQIETLPILEQ